MVIFVIIRDSRTSQRPLISSENMSLGFVILLRQSGCSLCNSWN